MTNKISIGFRVKKYIGKKAICKDNMEVGTITNFNVYKKHDGEYAVDYLLSMDKPHLSLRAVSENDIVILNDSKKV